MAEKTPQEELIETSVEDLQTVLDRRSITPRQYNELIREKARLTHLQILQTKGFVGVITEAYIEELEEGWETLVKAVGTRKELEALVAHKHPKTTPDERRALVEGMLPEIEGRGDVLSALFGLIQLLSAPVVATAKAAGTKIESLLLDAGASPGVSHFAGFTTELGIELGAGPVRIGVRGGVKLTEEIAAPVISRLINQVRELGPIRRLKQVVETTQQALTREMTDQASTLARGVQITRDSVQTATTQATRTLARETFNVALDDFARHMAVVISGNANRYSQKMHRFLVNHFDEAMANPKWSPAQALVWFADEVAVMKYGDLERMGRLTRQGVTSRLREIWLNTFILPLSVPTAFIGNSMNTAMEIGERFAGGGFRHGAAFMRGVFIRSQELLDAAATHLAKDASRLDRLAIESVGPTSGILMRLLTLNRLPTWGLQYVDNKIFDPRLRVASYFADAEIEGRMLGKTGKELGAFMRERALNPTDEMLRRAASLTDELTFRAELGPWAGKVRDVLQTGPGFFYFPIIKTPINAVKYTWRHTPGLQLIAARIYDDLAAGGSRAKAARGRLYVSNMVATYLYELAKNGFITGSGPANHAQRKAWLATHEPYTIGSPFPGGVRVSYRAIDPGIIALIADFAQVADQMDPRTFERFGHAALFSIYNNLGRNEWWGDISKFTNLAERGVADLLRPQDRDLVESSLVRALADPLTRTLAGFGSIGLRFRQIVDPTTREAGALLDDIYRSVPGFSQFQPARRDLYGDPIVPALPAGSSWFGFLGAAVPKVKIPSNDPIKIEGDKLGIQTGRGPFIPWTVRGVRLTVQQRDRIAQTYNLFVKDSKVGLKARTMDDPRYQEQTLDAQKALFELQLNIYRNSAIETAIAEDQGLQDAIIQKEKEQLDPRLAPSQRLLNMFKLSEAEGGELEPSVPEPSVQLTPEEVDNLQRFGGLPDEEPDVAPDGMPETLGGIPNGVEIPSEGSVSIIGVSPGFLDPPKRVIVPSPLTPEETGTGSVIVPPPIEMPSAVTPEELGIGRVLVPPALTPEETGTGQVLVPPPARGIRVRGR